MLNLQPGQMLGPYKIINQIGQGGMATVYKAYHASMDRYVALKVLSHQFAFSKEFYGRFQHEARLIAKLEHPHILPVHDFGESEGIPYLVMRFLDAGTLKDRLEAGSLALPEVDRIFSQLVQALGYAHENGIIHRDIKPSNAMLDKRGEVFLTDFGIAKLVEGSPQFTATGAITGTPAYMSPEQAQGLKIDQRSDIYSMGIVLYEMLTGHVPYEAETPLAVILKQIQEPLPPISTIKPDIHPSIEAVVLKALAKTPEDRYPACEALLSAWKHAYQEATAKIDTYSLKQPLPTAPKPPVQAPPPVARPVQQQAVARPAPPIPEKHPPQQQPVVEKPPVTAPPPAPSGVAQAPHKPSVLFQRFRSRKTIYAGIAGCSTLLVAVCACAFLFNYVKNQNPTATPTDLISMAPPDTADDSSVEPGVQSGPGAWTSWTAANSFVTLNIQGESILAGGAGGITIWNKRDHSYERITAQNGLPGPFVTTIFLDDRDGALWVGTDEGTARYANQSWDYFSTDQGLDAYYVTDIQTVGDTLWAGTIYADDNGEGLNRFNGQGWEESPGFPSMSEDDPAQSNSGTLSYNINMILGDENDNLWVATTRGVGFFDGQNWIVYDLSSGLQDENVTAMYFDSKGRFWTGSYDGWISKFNGNGFDPIINLSESGIYTVLGIIEDKSSMLWFSGSGGVARFNPENDGLTIYTMDRTNFPAYDMTSAAIDNTGVLYFGSWNEGLISYDGSFQVWSTPNMPRYTGYSSIVPAPDGNLWFVEEYGNNQIDVLDPNNLNWTEPPSNEVCCLIPLAWSSSGDLWSGGYSGLWIITSHGQQTNYGSEQGMPSDFVSAVAFTPDGGNWIGTDQGLVLVEGDRITAIFNSEKGDLPGNYILFLKTTSDGSLWIGSDQGLTQRSPSGEWIQYVAGKTFGSNLESVTDLAEAPDGSIWITTAGDGIYHLVSGDWNHFSPDNGNLPTGNTYFSSVAVGGDGSLWFGEYWEGAIRWKDDQWSLYSPQNGLIHPNVTDIFVDSTGSVWFSTSGGISRFQP